MSQADPLGRCKPSKSMDEIPRSRPAPMAGDVACKCRSYVPVAETSRGSALTAFESQIGGVPAPIQRLLLYLVASRLEGALSPPVTYGNAAACWYIRLFLKL